LGKKKNLDQKLGYKLRFFLHNRVICKVSHPCLDLVLGPPFTPYTIFQWYWQSNESFSLKASREGMICLAQFLDFFSIVSGFQINHAKSVAFWILGVERKVG